MLLAIAALALSSSACPSNLANDLASPAPAASRQLITVEAASAKATYARARIWTRVDGCWTSAGGPYTARVGRNGIAKRKREGDGTTPGGTFAIGARMYGNSPNPGVTYPYVRLRCGDWWVEDSKSRVYNTFQRVGCGRLPSFRVTTPDMSTSPRAYAHLAVIDYNTNPVVPKRGSGIFLHVQIGKATSGCISLRRPALVHVLRWLKSDALPQIAIGTTSSLRHVVTWSA
jgi:L,D-peptidoglycan transpeptidase YkuD (ErfK/YbiS/YcfS/YnhG family)